MISLDSFSLNLSRLVKVPTLALFVLVRGHASEGVTSRIGCPRSYCHIRELDHIRSFVIAGKKRIAVLAMIDPDSWFGQANNSQPDFGSSLSLLRQYFGFSSRRRAQIP